MPTDDEINIRPATLGDVPEIQILIEPFVEQKLILPRSGVELESLIENGFAAEYRDRIVGFAAIEVYSKKLAELLCLAVSRDFHGRGIGRQLIEWCVERASEHQVYELMAITSEDNFFESCGFHYTLPEQKRALFISTSPRH